MKYQEGSQQMKERHEKQHKKTRGLFQCCNVFCEPAECNKCESSKPSGTNRKRVRFGIMEGKETGLMYGVVMMECI